MYAWSKPGCILYNVWCIKPCVFNCCIVIFVTLINISIFRRKKKLKKKIYFVCSKLCNNKLVMDDLILCHITFERENGKRNETNIRKRHRKLWKYKGDQRRRATAMRRTYLGKNAHLHVLRHPVARSYDHCFYQRRSSKTHMRANGC